MLTGQLLQQLSISSLPPQVLVTAMQLVSIQKHQSKLAIAVSGSEQIHWVRIDDAAATEAVLAGRFAAMHVDLTGKSSKLLAICCYAYGAQQLYIRPAAAVLRTIMLAPHCLDPSAAKHLQQLQSTDVTDTCLADSASTNSDSDANSTEASDASESASLSRRSSASYFSSSSAKSSKQYD